MTNWRSIGDTEITIAPFFNLSIKKYAAAKSHDSQFHKYHVHEDGTVSRVRMPMICLDCGADVPRGDLASGVERGDEDVILSKEELDELEVDAGKELSIDKFSHEDEVSPLRLENAYYLAPDAKASNATLESYRLLVETLREGRLVGVLKYTDRGKTHQAVLRIAPDNDVLVLQNLMWADELREPDFTVLDKVSKVQIKPRAKKLFTEFVESMTEELTEDEFTDEFHELVEELIESKQSGVPRAKHEKVVPQAATDADDLIAKLEAAVAARSKSKATHPAGKRAGAKKAPAKAAPRRKTA